MQDELRSQHQFASALRVKALSSVGRDAESERRLDLMATFHPANSQRFRQRQFDCTLQDLVAEIERTHALTSASCM